MLIKWVVKKSVYPIRDTGQLSRYPAEPGTSRLKAGARWKGDYQILQSIADLEYKGNGRGIQL